MTAILLLTLVGIVPVSLALVGWVARNCARGQLPSNHLLRRVLGGQLSVFVVSYVVLLMWAAGSLQAKEAAAPEEVAAGQVAPRAGGLTIGDGLALIGVALATGLSVLGAGHAVATVGSACLGALTEKPEMFGRTLVFIGLAEGLAIYGLIISILILGRMG